MSKTLLPIVFAIVFVSTTVHAGDRPLMRASTTALSVSMGTVVIVEAETLAENFRRSRADLGKTFARIHTVDGRALDWPVVIELRSFSFHKVKLPAPGKRVRLAGYQTGAYTGIPPQAFKYIPQVATSGFHFETYFQACAVLPPKRPGLPNVTPDDSKAFNYSKAFTKVDKLNYDVDQALITAMLSDPIVLPGRGAHAIPNYRGGAFQGVRLVGVRPNSIFRAMGIRSGDTLHSVDGDKVQTETVMAKLFSMFRSKGKHLLHFERRNKPFTWTYTVK